jgi:Ca2+/H+ antiporter
VIHGRFWEKRGTKSILNLGLLIIGLAVIVWGADLLVSGAVDIAHVLRVSDAIIGLTMVAIGTSPPEIATARPCTAGHLNLRMLFAHLIPAVNVPYL